MDGDVDGLSLLFVLCARHATRISHRVGANVISGDVMNETGVCVETNAEGLTSEVFYGFSERNTHDYLQIFRLY